MWTDFAFFTRIRRHVQSAVAVAVAVAVATTATAAALRVRVLHAVNEM